MCVQQTYFVIELMIKNNDSNEMTFKMCFYIAYSDSNDHDRKEPNYRAIEKVQKSCPPKLKSQLSAMVLMHLKERIE